MRALLRFIAIVATTLAIGLGASAAYSGAPLTDQQKMWLAFHAVHLPPPAGIACIMQHESGTDYRFPADGRPPNGYEGAGQWVRGPVLGAAHGDTWANAARGSGWGIFAAWHVYDVPPAVQDQVMSWLAHADGWGPWPNTSRMCGLYGRGP